MNGMMGLETEHTATPRKKIEIEREEREKEKGEGWGGRRKNTCLQHLENGPNIQYKFNCASTGPEGATEAITRWGYFNLNHADKEPL